MSSSMGRIIYPIYEMENKSHVWNHQPDFIYYTTYTSRWYIRNYVIIVRQGADDILQDGAPQLKVGL